MRSTPDPISSIRRQARLTWIVAVPLAAASWTWALWPQYGAKIGVPVLKPAAASAAPEDPPQPLELAAFDAPLWVVPPAPIAKAPEPPPPPPEPVLDLQLVGIVRDESDPAGILRAAIYDPKTDRLFLVASGDQIGSRTVRKVTESAVELASRRSVSKLVLDERAKPAKKGSHS